MAGNKTAQGGISLRRKVTAWLAAILLVTMLSTGIATMAGQWTVRSFDMLLADNAVCYTVQNALKDETQAFARYVRQPTSETEQAYTAACTASEQSLAALPFDYARIGEERYARTWNLLQGYAGYRQERDAFLQLSPSADTYIEQMYHVMALQDYLAEYALRLTQATLEQENALYSSTAAHIRHLPWLYLGLFLTAAVLVLLLIRVLSRAVVRPLLELAQASRRGRFFQAGPTGEKQRRGGAADGNLQPDEARHGAAADHPAGFAPGRGAEPCTGKGSGAHPAGGA